MANAIARKGAFLSWRLETGNVPEQSRGVADRKEVWDGERNAERDLQEAGGQEVGDCMRQRLGSHWEGL